MPRSAPPSSCASCGSRTGRLAGVEPLEILRNVVILVHLVGFAVIFGSWVVELTSRRLQSTPLMDGGLGIALIAGLILAAPWPAGVELNYIKLGVKLVVLLVIGGLIGAGRARQRTGGTTPRAAFWLIGILTLTNAGIALIWQ